MIGMLRGMIISKQAPELLLDINGIGYEISAPMTTFYELPEVGHEVILHTHLVVREDAHLLYGFIDLKTRNLFRTLIKVNGVGPKLALTLLSGMDANTFVQCIQQGNTAVLVSIPGIGKKTAERLVIETRDALKQYSTIDTIEHTHSTTSNQEIEDAISALISLGYKPNDAKIAISRLDPTINSSEEFIRQALQQMARLK